MKEPDFTEWLIFKEYQRYTSILLIYIGGINININKKIDRLEEYIKNNKDNKK